MNLTRHFLFSITKRRRILKKRGNGCYIYSFKNYCHGLRPDCTTRRNAYAYRILWATFFVKYRKVAHRTLRLMRALLYWEHWDAWKKRKNERRKRYICSYQQSFRASSVFFCLGYITRPCLRAECFAEITCQNAYFLPASKFFWGWATKIFQRDGPQKLSALLFVLYIHLCPFN